MVHCCENPFYISCNKILLADNKLEQTEYKLYWNYLKDMCTKNAAKRYSLETNMAFEVTISASTIKFGTVIPTNLR